MKLLRRILSIMLIALMLITMRTSTALADYVRITDRNPDYQYFNYYSSGWKELKTPKHMIRNSSPEVVAYCLEHTNTSPGSTYYNSTTTPFSYFSGRTLKGLLIILEYGYPYNLGSGLNADQSRYATANAIRFWLSEEGVPNQYSFTNLSNVDLDQLASTGSVSNSYIRSNSRSGSLKTLRFAIDLLKRARSQERMPHEVNFTPSSVNVVKQGDNYVAQTKVTLTNLKGGYTLNKSGLPSGSTVSGYTGKSGDNLTISVPVASVVNGQSIALSASGSDNRVPSNLYWSVSASDTSKQNLVYMGTSIMPVGTGTLRLDTPNMGYIEIIKTDEATDEVLSGAVFQIIDSNGNEIDRLTTDQSGYAKSVELTASSYSIQEVTAPYGYVLNTTLHENIVVTAENTTTVTITNKKQIGIIKITKKDADTGSAPQGDAILSGAVFEIYNSDDELIERIECGENSFVESSELPLGEYKIIEVQPPVGYLINGEPQNVNLEPDNQTAVIIRQDVDVADSVITGNIAITKTFDTPLAEWELNNINRFEEIVFEIKLKSSGDLVETLQLDENGYTESGQLPYGTYTVIEKMPPTGYIPNAPFDVIIEEDGKTYTYDIENKVIRSQIKIVKKDIDTGKVIPIAGAGFQIYDILGELVTLDVMDVFETDEAGTIALNELLIYGEYTLHEIAPPYGYWLDETPLPFIIDETTNGLITVEFSNKLIQKKIRVIKSDALDGERRLEGAAFEVRSNGVLVDVIFTNENGYAETKLLPVGDYTVTEVKAPIGYVLDDTSFDVTISDDEENIYTINCTNQQSEVIIRKTDISDDTPLPNAHIEIFNTDDELVFQGNTNNDGELIIRELPVGKYTFKETSAPIGYTLNETVFEFEILEDGTILGATNVKDEPTKVTLTKRDITDSRGLLNAEIEVLNAESEIVFKGITDENGEIEITHLPVGTYIFKETQAPDGYIISEKEFEFTIDEYGVVTGITEMSNCPTELKIFKVKYEDNSPLTGAGFKIKKWFGLSTVILIKNADGTYRHDTAGDIQEIMVDINGEAIIYGLPYGDYWLEESTVPAGYYPTAPVRVTIDESTTVDVPYKAVIPNSEFVKLGLDRERWIYPVAGVLFLLLCGIGLYYIKKRKGEKT